VHHNQSLASLSKMSFGILQALIERLAADGKITLQARPGTIYNTISLTDGGYSLEAGEVKVIERPPARTVAGYPVAR
jgi:spore coat protein U-like protein